ncbi:MAG: pyridoxal kinase, partial [Marmoricola sp.]
IGLLAVTGSGTWSVSTPRLPLKSNGSGDVTAALFSAHLVETDEVATALARTASSVFDLLENTLEAKSRELRLVESQEAFAHPRLQFEVDHLSD